MGKPTIKTLSKEAQDAKNKASKLLSDTKLDVSPTNRKLLGEAVRSNDPHFLKGEKLKTAMLTAEQSLKVSQDLDSEPVESLGYGVVTPPSSLSREGGRARSGSVFAEDGDRKDQVEGRAAEVLSAIPEDGEDSEVDPVAAPAMLGTGAGEDTLESHAEVVAAIPQAEMADVAQRQTTEQQVQEIVGIQTATHTPVAPVTQQVGGSWWGWGTTALAAGAGFAIAGPVGAAAAAGLLTVATTGANYVWGGGTATQTRIDAVTIAEVPTADRAPGSNPFADGQNAAAVQDAVAAPSLVTEEGGDTTTAVGVTHDGEVEATATTVTAIAGDGLVPVDDQVAIGAVVGDAS